jgi:hypothetical protein
MFQKKGTKAMGLEARMDRDILQTALVFENKDES